MPTTYKDPTYAEVLRWTADTKIKYAPNPKKGKSFTRYGKYMKAANVAQAMKLGSYPQDLFFDYEHGYIKVVGGTRRQRPLKPDEEKDDWTDVDRMLAKMHRAWLHWKNTFAVAEKLGVDRRVLTGNKVTSETTEVRAARLAANELAKMVLKDVADKRRKICDRDVVAVLRMWGFKENTNRRGVIPDGKDFVFSDTLGLVSNYRGCVSVAQATTEYLAFTQVITGWLKDHMPNEFKKEAFGFTSINVNANYAAALHRDANNEGPSLIKAFGTFSGGELNYWQGDDKTKGSVEKVCKPGDCRTVDIKKGLLMFDGNRGHSVKDFKGERYSLVFFSIGQYHKADKKVQEELAKCGIRCPTAKGLTHAKKMLEAQDLSCLWPQREAANGTNFLTPSFVKKAKDAAYYKTEQGGAGADAEEEKECKDTKFVSHETRYVTLADGRRGVRVYLVGESGGKKLVVSGDEDEKGSNKYTYEKVKTFKAGPPLSATRLGEVRTWLTEVLGKPLQAPTKRCVHSFSAGEDQPTKKRRLFAGES